MPWVFNEDYAIKQKFQGLTVEDATNASRPVAVRFRLPETELANSTYPQIIIDPPEIRKADEREHRGPIYLPYVPEEYSAGGGADPVIGLDRDSKALVDWDPATSSVDESPFFVQDFPIPFDFDYQVMVETRKQSHLTQLMLKLTQIDYIPYRFGYLEVPADGTVRSLFLMGGPEIIPAKDVDSKRLFRAVYRVRIASELSTYQYQQITEGGLISHVTLDVEEIPEV